ncbi:MAG TPA: CvpA family protein [Candidatus Eremiobacteraceae bacterium]|nr:CvpA family protein [Candidatus Eremiobacteraceae bacterium]
MNWVDALVVLTLAAAFWGGYRNGLVRELVGLAAVVLAWFGAAAFANPAAEWIAAQWGLAASVARVAAFWSVFLALFVAVRAAGWLLDRVAKLPVINIASGIGGGLASCVKALVLLWAILFVALFFPMDNDVRSALKTSPSATFIASFDAPVTAAIDAALPRLARPVWHVVMRKHHL